MQKKLHLNLRSAGKCGFCRTWFCFPNLPNHPRSNPNPFYYPMKIQFRFLCRGLLLAAAVLPLANCSSISPQAGYAPAPTGTVAEYGSNNPSAAKKKTSRQGLATQAGHEMYSSVADSAFYRKTTGLPDAVDSFHYNDETGAKAMADALGGGSKKRGTFSVAGGRVDVALKGSYSGPFERYETGGKRIVIGSPGSNYQIFLSNQTKHAVEVVASVDSLDVMDGKTASVKKRGYVIPAKGELAIEGFRVNSKTVKGFVFGSVDDSAAAKAGAARNVGVIGLAVYDEDEAQATMARLIESQKRSAASPF
jgi:hypothetical protein